MLPSKNTALLTLDTKKWIEIQSEVTFWLRDGPLCNSREWRDDSEFCKEWFPCRELDELSRVILTCL